MSQQQKCSLGLYRDFLIANSNRYSGVELSKVEPSDSMAHDSVTRWLCRADFTPSDVWRYAKPLVTLDGGYLIVDDTVAGKPFATNIDLARPQYSGREHRVVNGIDIVNFLWTAGEEYVPVDYRVYAPMHDGHGKNDHFQEMLGKASKRGFAPLYVLLDSWYSGLENLKAIRKHGWQWITNLKSNRLVSPTRGTYVTVSDLDLGEGTVKHVWLKGYGEVVVAKLDIGHGDIRYLASDDLQLLEGGFAALKEHWDKRWKIEEFHEGLKQTTGVSNCSAQRAHAQRIHIFSSMVAFLKLEAIRQQTKLTWYEQKAAISRPATRAYLAANA
jgi:hypothetical protein